LVYPAVVKRVVAAVAVLALAGCRDKATPRIRADDVRVSPSSPEPEPAPPPAKAISKWSDLGPLIEPCVELEEVDPSVGDNKGDSKVHVAVDGGKARVIRVGCIAEGTSQRCLERAIASATCAPSLTTSGETLMITRRNAGTGPVRFGPVRVRTLKDILSARARGAAGSPRVRASTDQPARCRA